MKLNIASHTFHWETLLVYLVGVEEPLVCDLIKEGDYFDTPTGEEAGTAVVGFDNPRFFDCPVILTKEAENQISKLI